MANPSDLVDVLAEIEAIQVLDEHMVAERVKGLARELKEAKYEFLGFSFSEHGESPWGTHFAPLFQGTSADGQPVTFPDVSQVTNEMLDYWEVRARAVTHPVMRARYAGLVWEFSRVVSGARRDPDMARARVDAIVETANANRYTHDVFTWTLLEHALGLAVAMKDAGRRDRVIQAILDFESRVGVDDKPGLWAPSFDLLYGKAKMGVTAAHEQVLVSRLEDRLARIVALGDGGDPWAAESAAEMLARHYRRVGAQADVERVLLAAGQLREAAAAKANAMVAQSWLQDLHEVYSNFGLNGEASRLLERIAELGPAVRGEMKEVQHTFEITDEKMKQFVDEALGGTAREVHVRFAVRFVPRIGDIKQQLTKLSASAPLSFLIPRQLMDEDGRPVATIGSLDSDPDGHLVLQMAQNMGISAVFMRHVLDAMVARGLVTEKSLDELFRASPLFVERNHGLLMAGVRAYFAQDAAAAIHLLIPQIESAIRELGAVVGAPRLKPNKSGGMDHRLLDELLRDPLVLGALTEDVAAYLRVLLTDRRGVNLRNQVCHGLIAAESLHIGWADRVLHALLLLLLIEVVDDAEEPTAGA